MTTHPYRTYSPPASETEVTDRDDGAGIAFGVMAFTGAVQVAIAALHPGPPSAQTALGAACFAAGLAWLLRAKPRGTPADPSLR